jgi:hypothetical protein
MVECAPLQELDDIKLISIYRNRVNFGKKKPHRRDTIPGGDSMARFW